jgi:putative addiction module killer protein
MYEIELYQTKEGKCPFSQWMSSLKDANARAKVDVRLARIRLGNAGDFKFIGEGVFELRIDYGLGYRVYFAHVDPTRKLILLGGSKKTQTKDIKQAQGYLKDYKERIK